MTEDFPMATLFVAESYDAFLTNVTGWVSNNIYKLDFYPVSFKTINITGSSDTWYERGKTGNLIQWNITADFIENPYYNLYINDILNTSDTWTTSEPVSIDVDGHSPGIYEYRIEVHSGPMIKNDTIIVKVLNLQITKINSINTTYAQGETGNLIQWNITADFIENPYYKLYINDILNTSDTWTTSEPVSLDVDGHSPGIYEYRIEVHNGPMIKNDTIIVKVLDVDNLKLTLNRPSDISYMESETGNIILWNITSEAILDPSYDLYINDILNHTGIWESGISIMINVDGLSVGNYEYRIEVHNGPWIENDTVRVDVLEKKSSQNIPGYPIFGFILTCTLITIISRLKKRK
jgi:hypothetical protein